MDISIEALRRQWTMRAVAEDRASFHVHCCPEHEGERAPTKVCPGLYGVMTNAEMLAQHGLRMHGIPPWFRRTGRPSSEIPG